MSQIYGFSFCMKGKGSSLRVVGKSRSITKLFFIPFFDRLINDKDSFELSEKEIEIVKYKE